MNSVRLRRTQALLLAWPLALGNLVSVLPIAATRAFAADPPTCNGRPATVYVDAGMVVGGPLNGSAYAGTLTGTADADVIVGTNGNDAIDAGEGANTVCSLDGDDSLTGGGQDDWMDAGSGNNTVNAGAGHNVVVTGNGHDTVTAGDGNDQVIAGEGDNTISVGLGVNTVTAGNGHDRITTGDWDDTIAAGDGDNTIVAGAGDDTITAGGGHDTVDGGVGIDSCAVSGGNNTVSNCEGEGSGTITVRLDAAPDSAQDFSFGGYFGAFTLDDDADPTLLNSISRTKPVGTFLISQATVAGWTLGIACNDAGSTATGSTATIDLDNGENITCTFTNTQAAPPTPPEEPGEPGQPDEDDTTVTPPAEQPAAPIGSNAADFSSSNQGSGAGRGNGTNTAFSVVDAVAGMHGVGDAPPGGFGGTDQTPLSAGEINFLCSLQRSFGDDRNGGFFQVMTRHVADTMGRESEDVEDWLRDSDLCKGILAQLQTKKIVAVVVTRPKFYVDANNIPLSENPTWNGCIRGYVSLELLRANPDVDDNGNPRTCAHYRSEGIWRHPDLNVEFSYDRKTGTLIVPDDYEVVKAETTL